MPAFRQEQTILEDIRALASALAETSYDYELIVVVDGEVDRTARRARRATTDHIRVLSYSQNQGKGHAVRHGMLQADGDVIGFMDAGGELPPKAISHLLTQLLEHRADMVVGSKRHPNSAVSYPLVRHAYSWGYQMLTRLLFGLNVRDTQVGLKLFRREVVDKALPLLLVKRFAFDIEFLAVAHTMGFKRLEEAPVTLQHNFSSTIDLQAVWHMLWDTAAVFYRLRILNYYQRKAKEVPSLTNPSPSDS